MNILQNKKLIAIIGSALTLVLILVLVLSLTMCNRTTPVGTSSLPSEYLSESTSIDESSAETSEETSIGDSSAASYAMATSSRKSQTKNSSTPTSSSQTSSATSSKPQPKPEPPPESSQEPEGRTEEEIEKLTEEAMKSGNSYLVRVHIKPKFWVDGKVWAKSDFPGINIFDEIWELPKIYYEISGIRGVMFDINSTDEDELRAQINKLYHFNFIEKIERGVSGGW